ncbi:hypothetical protein DM02DRAFT_634307 [Periconia macrospinosa]|uniref:Uncharacterized protein n=1 Tax=Periconia macrospinosa TaxID=97972 RepID=A0A2V1D968_9PLEO|nr:hypothetical protein DM02DRAFT_634307 [Periconia macrospinosa]
MSPIPDPDRLNDGTEMSYRTTEEGEGLASDVVRRAEITAPPPPIISHVETRDSHGSVTTKTHDQPMRKIVGWGVPQRCWRVQQRCWHFVRSRTKRKHAERTSLTPPWVNHRNPYAITAVMDDTQGGTHRITILLDTGSEDSVLCADTARLLPKNLISTANETFAETLLGQPISSCGSVIVRWHGLDSRFRNKFEQTEFRVLDRSIEYNAILGYKEIIRLGIDMNRQKLGPVAPFFRSKAPKVDEETAAREEQTASLDQQIEYDEQRRDEERRELRHAYAYAEATKLANVYAEQVARAGSQLLDTQYKTLWHEYYQAYARKYDERYPRS